MFRDLLVSLAALLAVVPFGWSASMPAAARQSAGQPANQSPSASTNQTPDPAADPAAVVFASPAGLVLHAVKPASVADYEAAITALQQALSSSTDAAVRDVARGWRVFKAADGDAKTALYVHWLEPTVAGTDYRPSLWLDRLLEGAPEDLLAKYRDAFAAPPTKLSLTEWANMTVAPAPKPANQSPTHPSGNREPSR